MKKKVAQTFFVYKDEECVQNGCRPVANAAHCFSTYKLSKSLRFAQFRKSGTFIFIIIIFLAPRSSDVTKTLAEC